jgi:Skp family chaperone for outer membrane proteins
LATAVLIAFTFCLAAPSAPAQSPAPAVVLVVDIQRIMRDSKAAQTIRSQVNDQREKFQAEFAEREKKLREEEQSLARQRTILTAEVFQQKLKEFEGRIATVQRDAQGRRQEVEAALNRALQDIRGVLVNIVGKMADEQKATVVLPKVSVFLVDKKLEITEDVLARLDAELPKVTVRVPVAGEQGQTAKQ